MKNQSKMTSQDKDLTMNSTRARELDNVPDGGYYIDRLSAEEGGGRGIFGINSAFCYETPVNPEEALKKYTQPSPRT